MTADGDFLLGVCALCKDETRPINPSPNVTYQRMECWGITVDTRASGKKGGRDVCLCEPHRNRQVAHPDCVEKAKRGLLNQEAFPIPLGGIHPDGR